MKCKECGSKTIVIDSRVRNGQVYRRRLCPTCQCRFSTYEVYGEIIPWRNKKGGQLKACIQKLQVTSQEELATMMECLTDREKTVIRLRVQEKTLDEIAQQFGVTKERVRQIEKKSILKLAMYGLVSS